MSRFWKIIDMSIQIRKACILPLDYKIRRISEVQKFVILIFALKYQVWYQSESPCLCTPFFFDLLFVYGGWYQLNPYLCSWPFNVVCWSVREAVTFCGMRHSTRLQLWGIWGQFRNSWEQIAPFLSNRVEVGKWNHHHQNLINYLGSEGPVVQFWKSRTKVLAHNYSTGTFLAQTTPKSLTAETKEP